MIKNNFLDFRKRLNSEFLLLQKKSSRYSLRAFAHKLDIDVSTLSKIMKGKRALGAKTIRTLCEKLKIPSAEIENYVAAQKQRRRLGTSLKADARRSQYEILDESSAELMSRWESYAVVELTYLPRFVCTPESVAQALGISNKDAANLLHQMVQAKWIEADTEQGFIACIRNTSTDPENINLSVIRKKLMHAILQKSLSSYLELPRGSTIHYGRTFKFDRKLIPDIMEKIRTFGDEIESFIEENTDEYNDVQQLQIGFYPLTNLGLKS